MKEVARMAIKLSGLSSGMDTESIVTQLMEAHSYKKTKVVNKQTKLTWTQDKWKELNTKIYKLYTEQASKLRFTNNYQTKLATSSNDKAFTVTAGSTASTGSHTIEIKELASSQYVTGGIVNNASGKVTSTTKLQGMIGTSGAGTVITIDGPDTSAGNNKVELTVTDKTTVADFVSACKDAGLNASFDEKQQRFFISSKTSGADQQFSITTTSVSSGYIASETAIKGSVNYSALSSEDKKKVDDALKTLRAGEGETEDAYQVTEERKAAVETLQEFGDKVAESKVIAAANNKVMDAVKGNMGTMEEVVRKQLEDSIKKQNPDIAEEELASKVKEQYETLITEDKEQLYNQAVQAKYNEVRNEAEYQQVYDEFYNEYIEDFKQKQTNEITGALTTYVKESVNSSNASTGALEALGLGEIVMTTDASGKSNVSTTSTGGMTLVAASDAEFILDGATLTAGENTVTVNGVTFTLKMKTEGAETVSVTNNTQAVYDMIKGFVKEFNGLLEEMNTSYYADSAKGYDPLTDEEKSAMTDSQIELWETKIKDSLLRRDPVLGNLITSMKSSLNKGVTVNDKQYSLSYFGICTSSDYSEKGLLHIYGDKEDSTYADLDDKLMKAIEEDPELVANVFSQMATNLYDTMTEKMKSSSLSSALTFYNDKQMTKLQQQYTKDIATIESRLSAMETRYYKQFTAMETALAKINSQSSYLGGLFSS